MRRRLPIAIIFLSGVFFFHLTWFPPFAAQAEAGATWYVDDDAPNDPGPGTTTVSDLDEDGTPDHPFDAIQEAIDAASDGDTIIVRDGTYTGGGNRDIDFKGKAVHLMSENGPENCVIDAQGTEAEEHRGFVFQNGEGEDSIVNGFTITGGYAYHVGSTFWGAGMGGGVLYALNSSPTLMNNTITGNSGGGVFPWHAGACVIVNNIIALNTGVGIRYGQGATVTGNTIIGNTGAGIGMYFSSGTIANNMITGNSPGIAIHYSSATIVNNTIVDNTFNWAGAGIQLVGSNGGLATIAGNIITGNTTLDAFGGGFACTSLYTLTITNNIIARNSATGENAYGGAMYIGVSATGTIANNTIVDNTAEVSGGGIVCHSSNVSITNNILWGNNGNLEVCTATYSCVENGAAGVGNIDANPLFADPDNDDYHLKSEAGRWSPAANGGAGGWVYDDVTSPCIDAGDPASAYDNEPQGNGARVNMGAYGNTVEASRTSIFGDVTGDCHVNILDMIAVRNHLGQDVVTGDNWRYDLTDDGRINILDMLVVRDNLNMTCTE